MENPSQAEIQTETQPEAKTTHCLNCGTEFEGNFCPECGQSADTSRFTMKFISQNLLTAILSNDGGVWFTLKSLFTRPSAMVVEILNGKRKRYFSPFPMLFFALTVYILMFTFTGSRQSIQGLESLSVENTEIAKSDTTVFSSDLERKESVKEEITNRVSWYIGTAIKFYNNHYTAVFMLTLPILLLPHGLVMAKATGSVITKRNTLSPSSIRWSWWSSSDVWSALCICFRNEPPKLSTTFSWLSSLQPSLPVSARCWGSESRKLPGAAYWRLSCITSF